MLRQRLRTMLCVLKSVADHMATDARSPEELRMELSGRIGAIARASQAWGDEGVDLENLVLDELLLHAVRADVAEIEGCDVRLPPKPAQIMGLAIHELATNAVKFGALRASGGRIKIAWRFVYHLDQRRLRFEWRESGVTNPAPPARRGFGFDLVERLIASQLKGGGEMIMLPDGVHCTIEIPMGSA